MPTITVLIDSPPTARFHFATLAALRHAIDRRDDHASFAIDVVHTDAIESLGDAVVIGPGAPYNDPRASEDVVTGEVRAAERIDHPFVVDTLFQPQLTSTPESPHPIWSAFVAAIATA